MKRFVFLLFFLALVSCHAQQPIMRNAMTTNIAGTPVLSFTNLTVTNINSGTNWIFGGARSNTVARLMDIVASLGITAAQASNIVTGMTSNYFIWMTNGFGTNTILDNPTLTNGINYGNAFSSPGIGTDSEEFGANAVATNTDATAVGNGAVAGHTQSTAVGKDAYALRSNATAIGNEARAYLNATAVGSSSYAETNSTSIGLNAITGRRSIAIGQSAGSFDKGIAIGVNSSTAGYSNAVVIGDSAVADEEYQFLLGTSSHIVDIPGFLEIPQNAALNRVWSCTNAATGRGTWVALSPPPPAPPTDYVTNNNGWGTNMVDWGTNFTSMSNLNVGGSLYVSNGVWITNVDNLGQLLYVNSAGSNLSAYLGTNVYIAGGSGDVNGSGTINALDITLIRNYLSAASIFDADQFARANILGDNVVSGSDILWIRRVILGTYNIRDAKYNARRMKGRAWSVDVNGMNRLGYQTDGDLTPFLGIVEIVSSGTTNPPALFVVNTNKFFVDTNGWVGIGTNLPQAALHVYSNSIFDGSVQLGWVTGSKLAEFDSNRLLTNSAYSATELTNPLATITYTDTKQYGCDNLTNWCQISTNDFLNATSITNLINEHAYGQTWYVWGSSNTVATNAAGVAYKAMQKSDVPLPATANTNTYTSPAPGDYVAEVVTAIPAGITSLNPGDIFTVSYAYLSAANTMTIQPEIYIRTNLYAPSFSELGEREIAVGDTVTISGTTPQSVSVMVPLTTNVVLSATNYLVRKYRVTARTGTPNISFISQGAYPARVVFPIGSAAFVLKSGDTMSGSLTMNGGQFIGNGEGLTNLNGNMLFWPTNALASTNSIDMSLDEQLIVASGTISFSNCLNTSTTRFRKSSVLIDANGSDRILRIPDWVKTTDGLRTWTVTNGIRGFLYVETWGQLYTNASYTPLY